jgi:hypothetical protein
MCEAFYIITNGLLKLAYLFFYLRIFPSQSFRIKCWITIGICIATTIAYAVVTFLQCSPVSFAWNKDTRDGSCVDYNAVAWSHSGVNIVQDFVILFLPLPELRRLRITARKKIGLLLVFGLGGL